MDTSQKPSFDDDDVINIMVDGGKRLCDYALEQWIGDKYKMGEEVRHQYIAEWKAKKARISPIAKEWKQQIKTRSQP